MLLFYFNIMKNSLVWMTAIFFDFHVNAQQSEMFVTLNYVTNTC